MQRKELKRAQGIDIDYRPSKRVMQQQHRPSRQGRAGFTHRPRARARPRNIGRRILIAACLEEFRHGGDSIAALYAALLSGRLAALEPHLAEEFDIPVEVIED